MAEPFIGEIRLFAGTFVPAGWALCNGVSLPVAQNQALYAAIGNTYGGDGVNFNLPNLCGRIPVGAGTTTTNNNYTVGSWAGTEAVALTSDQIPQHTHAPMSQSAAATQPGPAGAVWATDSTKNLYGPPPANTAMNPAAVAQAGNGQAHDNMMPFLPLNFIISLTDGSN